MQKDIDIAIQAIYKPSTVPVYNIPNRCHSESPGDPAPQWHPPTRRLLTVLFVLLSRDAAAALPAVRSFDGDRGPGLEVCGAKTPPPHCDRAEMTVAANGTQVAQATWQNLNIYDYEGRLLKSTPMPSVIRDAGLEPLPHNVHGPFEPHLAYNEFIARWVMTVTCLNDCLLVSATSDARGPWKGTYLTCLQGGPCLDHDPSMRFGYDKNGVYACGGHIGDDNPATVPTVAMDCFALPSAEVKAIGQGTPPTHINRVHNMPIDVMPAVDHNPSKAPTAPAFLANKSCERTAPYACQRSTNFAFDWVVNRFTWIGATGTWNAGGTQQLIATDVGSTRKKWLYNSPCCGETMSVPQAGTGVTLRASPSHRLMNVVQYGSHLHGVLGTGPCTGANCGTQGADANNIMIWVDLDCSNPKACVVSRTSKIADADRHLMFGTAGVDAAGNLGIVATTSSPREHLSVSLWTRRHDDAADTFRGPTAIVSGTQPNTCLNAKNMVSIGNSVGLLTALDPDGSKLWTTQQWGGDAAPCVWKTRIVGYQIDASGKGPAKGQKRAKGQR